MKVIAEMSKAEYQADIPQYITYGPTNSKAYETGKIDDALSRNLPSHPDNASKLLAISQEWYAKWEKIGSEMYVDMMTE